MYSVKEINKRIKALIFLRRKATGNLKFQNIINNELDSLYNIKFMLLENLEEE